MKAERLENTSIICRGGLDSNDNWLYINSTNMGVASDLVNYEPSLLGGYRRINGFSILESTDNGEVDPIGAEGKIYGIFFYNNNIIAARKQQSGNTYDFYQYVISSSWSKLSTPFSKSSVNVNRVKYDTFNFDGTEKVIFIDGVNKASLYDGSTWTQINSANSGANYANAGGAQALNSPTSVRVFKNHIFIANGNVIAHSAPNAEYDWTVANGAGQINAGMNVVQIYPFRDELYVFGQRKIKKIVVDSSGAFVIQSVTEDIGCIAPDSVTEINGDLIFLTNDGIRPLSATERINDVELASISKSIQQTIYELLNLYPNDDAMVVTIPSKSQFRLFFTPESVNEDIAPGIIGAIREYSGQYTWEYSLTRGIKVSCVSQGRYGTPLREYVLHGTYDGKVMRQESGSSFNGNSILSVFSTPYIDFQTPMVRKTPQEIMLFIRAEGEVTLSIGLKYDWGDVNYINPSNYLDVVDFAGSFYGTGVYGITVYGDSRYPIPITNIEGSGKSMRFSFISSGTGPSFTIQGFTVKYRMEGYK